MLYKSISHGSSPNPDHLPLALELFALHPASPANTNAAHTVQGIKGDPGSSPEQIKGHLHPEGYPVLLVRLSKEKHTH